MPWDDAGPFLRFSVTYEAADEAAEDELMEQAAVATQAGQAAIRVLDVSTANSDTDLQRPAGLGRIQHVRVLAASSVPNPCHTSVIVSLRRPSQHVWHGLPPKQPGTLPSHHGGKPCEVSR